MSPIIEIVATLIPVLFDAVPCLTLVITTTILLVYGIRKTNRPINKRNIFIVVIVTLTFLLSFLPYFVFISAESSPYDNLAHVLYNDRVFESTWSLTFLSTFSNPIIYVIMNQSFREFAKKKICFWRQRSQDNSRHQPSIQEATS